VSYFNDSLQTVYAGGGGRGSQEREVADADVVFWPMSRCIIYRHLFYMDQNRHTKIYKQVCTKDGHNYDVT